MQVASRPASAPKQQADPRHDVAFFRGVRFQREVAWYFNDGNHRWRMVAPVCGPAFSNMKEARAWCREHGVQHAAWKHGFSHDPGHPSWGAAGFN